MQFIEQQADPRQGISNLMGDARRQAAEGSEALHAFHAPAHIGSLRQVLNGDNAPFFAAERHRKQGDAKGLVLAFPLEIEISAPKTAQAFRQRFSQSLPDFRPSLQGLLKGDRARRPLEIQDTQNRAIGRSHPAFRIQSKNACFNILDNGLLEISLPQNFIAGAPQVGQGLDEFFMTAA